MAERRPTDEQLSELTGAGDAEAFAALYRRHVQEVYDLAVRAVGDGDAAADVVYHGFATVWDTLQKRRVENIRACIYAAAYAAAVAHPRARDAGSGTEQAHGGPNFTGLDTGRVADPAALLRDPDLVELVWDAAAVLGPRDYGLLDLQLRKRLAAADLAKELRVKGGALEARLARIKDAFVQSVLAAREKTAPSRMSPLAVFASLAPLAVPPGLEDAVWARLLEHTREPPPSHWKRRKRVIVLAGAGLTAVIAAGAILAVRAGGGPHDPTGFQSTTHQIGAETSDATIAVGWTPEPDATGYSILWSSEPALPDETVDLAGNQAHATRVVTPGQWWFNLRTRDADGDWTHTVHLGPYVVVAVPNTRITSRPAKLSNDGRPVFRLEASGEGTFECSLDGARFERCGARTAIGRVRDGRHRLRARIRDRYGNADATPAAWVWRVDTTAPRTRIVSAQFDKDKAVFRITAGERRASFECRLDDGEFTRCKPPVTIDDLSEGDHLFVVRATDAAGNRDGSAEVRRWSVDTKRPKTRIVSGPSGVVHRRKAIFGLDSNEDEVTFECSLDGGAYQACGVNVAYPALGLGEHTFLARARDEAGNVDGTPARRRWTIVDTSRPDTTITSHPGIDSKDRSPTFRFRSSEAGSRFECRLDSGPWRSCSSPKTYKGLARGSHIFRVRARDSAGNVDRTPATWSWTIN